VIVTFITGLFIRHWEFGTMLTYRQLWISKPELFYGSHTLLRQRSTSTHRSVRLLDLLQHNVCPWVIHYLSAFFVVASGLWMILGH
jgi:hypothetical protein